MTSRFNLYRQCHARTGMRAQAELLLAGELADASGYCHVNYLPLKFGRAVAVLP